MSGKAFSNHILGYSFLASVLINMGWVAWVAHSSVFGGAVTLTNLHERPIRIFKPVPVKPKPKTATPLPPPPPPKPPKAQAEIKPLRPLRLIAPVPPNVHRQPARHTQTAAPAPPRTVSIAQAQPAPAQAPITSRPVSPTRPARPVTLAALPHSAGSLLRAPEPGNIGPIQPVAPPPTQPSAPAIRQPETQPSVKAQERVVKPLETETKHADPTPVVRHVEEVRPQPEPEITKPRPVEHPKNWVPVEAREARLDGDIEVPPLPDGVELGQLENTTVIISYEVDETGHPTNVKVRQRSGNSEVDEKCIEAVRRAHYLPAVQDHVPYVARTSYRFSYSS